MSMSTSTSRSTSSSVLVPGDRGLRVTVPLPQQLKELRGEAGRAFNTLMPRQKFEMWHKGKTLLKEPQQMSCVKHGDLVVIRPDEEAPARTDMQSTSRAEFVAHPIPQKCVPRKAQPPPSAKFEGTTENKTAYVNHPREQSAPARPKSSGWKPQQVGFQGESTYKLHYPGHQATVEPRTPPRAWKPSSAPFEGTTSYTQDYVKHPSAGNRPKCQPQRHLADVPFRGESSYRQAFRPLGRVQPASPPPPTKRAESLPFQGQSEYSVTYQKHKLNDSVVHLEPALGRRPGSAPHPRSKAGQGGQPATARQAGE